MVIIAITIITLIISISIFATILVAQIIVSSVSIHRGYREQHYMQIRKKRIKTLIISIICIFTIAILLNISFYKMYSLQDILGNEAIRSIQVYLYQPDEPEKLIFQSENSDQITLLLSGLSNYKCQRRITGSQTKNVQMQNEEFMVVILNGTNHIAVFNMFQRNLFTFNGQAYVVNSKNQDQETLYEYWQQKDL